MINKFKLKIENWKLKIPAKQAGFTVLESIVAIFILSLSIAGAFSAIQQNLSLSIISKDEVKAFYLAQEAIEIIRNKRDSNQIAKIDSPIHGWLYGIAEDIDDPCYFGKVCRVDANPMPPTLTYCGNAWDSCPNLLQNQSTYVHNYSSGDATSFKREIQLEQISATEIAVIVRVKWTKGILPFEFKVKTLMFDWI